MFVCPSRPSRARELKLKVVDDGEKALASRPSRARELKLDKMEKMGVK